MSPYPPPFVPFATSLWIAARLMPVVAKRAAIGELLASATPDPAVRAYGELTTEDIVAAVKQTTSRPWRMRGRRCLREGLLAFRYLSLADHCPSIHFAVDPASLKTARARAHCWITVRGDTVMNPPDPSMIELFSYDGSASIPTAEIRTTETAHFV